MAASFLARSVILVPLGSFVLLTFATFEHQERGPPSSRSTLNDPPTAPDAICPTNTLHHLNKQNRVCTIVPEDDHFPDRGVEEERKNGIPFHYDRYNHRGSGLDGCCLAWLSGDGTAAATLRLPPADQHRNYAPGSRSKTPGRGRSSRREGSASRGRSGGRSGRSGSTCAHAGSSTSGSGGSSRPPPRKPPHGSCLWKIGHHNGSFHNGSAHNGSQHNGHPPLAPTSTTLLSSHNGISFHKGRGAGAVRGGSGLNGRGGLKGRFGSKGRSRVSSSPDSEETAALVGGGAHLRRTDAFPALRDVFLQIVQKYVGEGCDDDEYGLHAWSPPIRAKVCGVVHDFDLRVGMELVNQTKCTSMVL